MSGVCIAMIVVDVLVVPCSVIAIDERREIHDAIVRPLSLRTKNWRMVEDELPESSGNPEPGGYADPMEVAPAVIRSFEAGADDSIWT